MDTVVGTIARVRHTHPYPHCHWKDKIKKPQKVTANRKELPYNSICKTCIGLETDDIMEMFVTLEYNDKQELFEGFSVDLYDARHIPGSASILIYIQQEQ
jgi:Cft2 family RNA processing exonuclease